MIPSYQQANTSACQSASCKSADLSVAGVEDSKQLVYIHCFFGGIGVMPFVLFKALPSKGNECPHVMVKPCITVV